MINTSVFLATQASVHDTYRAQQKARKRAIKEAKKGIKHLQKAQALGVKLTIPPEEIQKLIDLAK